jgi:hypothetical protein
VEDFIAQDLIEYRPRPWIIIHDIPIDRKTAGSGFFRHVQESEQMMVRLFLDTQVVETVTAGQWAPVEQRLESRGVRPEKRGATLTEQVAVVELVDRVFQVEPAQERVRGHFSRPQDIASAVGLDFGEQEQLANAPVEIAPNPSVNRPQHPVSRFHISMSSAPR